jgi:hypothetical protein
MEENSYCPVLYYCPSILYLNSFGLTGISGWANASEYLG